MCSVGFSCSLKQHFFFTEFKRRVPVAMFEVTIVRIIAQVAGFSAIEKSETVQTEA